MKITAIIIVCLTLGFFMPLSSSSAMGSVTRGHGAASAVMIFAAYAIMALWSVIQAYIHVATHEFMMIGMWITLVVVLGINLTLIILDRLRNSE